MGLRPLPLPAASEDEPEVRPRRRQGHRVSDRAREGQGPLRACGRRVHRVEPEEVVHRVREGVRGEAYLPRLEGELGRALEGLRRGAQVPLPAQDDPEVVPDRRVLSAPAAHEGQRFLEPAPCARQVALRDEGRAQVRQGPRLLPGLVLQEFGGPREVLNRRGQVPELPLDPAEGPDGLALEGRPAEGLRRRGREDLPGPRILPEAIRDAPQVDSGAHPFLGRSLLREFLEGRAGLLELPEEHLRLREQASRPTVRGQTSQARLEVPRPSALRIGLSVG